MSEFDRNDWEEAERHRLLSLLVTNRHAEPLLELIVAGEIDITEAQTTQGSRLHKVDTRGRPTWATVNIENMPDDVVVAKLSVSYPRVKTYTFDSTGKATRRYPYGQERRFGLASKMLFPRTATGLKYYKRVGNQPGVNEELA